MDFTDLVSDPEALLATEFAIGETRFRIAKLAAIPAWRLLERIRAEVGRTLQGLDMPEAGEGKSAAMVAALSAVLALPEPFVESLRVTLFKHVQYSNRHVGQLSPLDGSEDSAFDGLEPVAVYEVLVRSLAVNFSPSFRGLFALTSFGAATSSPPEPSG